MIAIVDYGMGNLLSVCKAFAKIGYPAEITSDPRRILSAEGVVLPGVGAFADAMKNLISTGIGEAIKLAVAREVPFLGICLGLHLIFSKSYEDGEHTGLDIIPGEVKRLPNNVKVPHMGWNQIEIQKECRILEGVKDGSFLYFVHSYYVSPEDERAVAATTIYGCRFTAVICKGNIFGIQFHPEKSSTVGLKILKNFGELVESAGYSGS